MSRSAIAPKIVRTVYGVYAWSALVVAAVPALVVLTVIPRRDTRRRVTGWFARLFFLSIGSPVQYRGDRVLPDGACVVIANHSSYLDGIILTAALPPRLPPPWLEPPRFPPPHCA